MPQFMNASKEKMKALYAKHGNNPTYAAHLAAVAKPYTLNEIVVKSKAGLLLEIKTSSDPRDKIIRLEAPGKVVLVAADGRPIIQHIDANEVPLLETKITGLMGFDDVDLENGVLRSIDDQKKTIELLAKAELEKRCFGALNLAVPVANRVKSYDGVMTESAAKAAITIVEDQDRELGNIACRAQHVNFDMSKWNLSDKIREELMAKGVVRTLNGANVIKTSKMPLNNILFTPDEFVGKCIITYFNVKPWYGGEPGMTYLFVDLRAVIGIAKGELMALVDVQTASAPE